MKTTCVCSQLADVWRHTCSSQRYLEENRAVSCRKIIGSWVPKLSKNGVFRSRQNERTIRHKTAPTTLPAAIKDFQKLFVGHYTIAHRIWRVQMALHGLTDLKFEQTKVLGYSKLPGDFEKNKKIRQNFSSGFMLAIQPAGRPKALLSIC